MNAYLKPIKSEHGKWVVGFKRWFHRRFSQIREVEFDSKDECLEYLKKDCDENWGGYRLESKYVLIIVDER